MTAYNIEPGDFVRLTVIDGEMRDVMGNVVDKLDGDVGYDYILVIEDVLSGEKVEAPVFDTQIVSIVEIPSW
jgi:hypothetical protein